MATRECPRCEVRVDSVIDKSRHRWQWAKKKNTYVCRACESELVAKELKLKAVIYTLNYDRNAPLSPPPRIDIPRKKSRRKPKLCPQCKEVTFLIGVAVYRDRPKPLVCSNKCKLRRRKQDREESAA